MIGVRVVPATIAAAVLALGLRIGDIWQESGSAFAQQPPAAAAKPPAPAASPTLPAPPPTTNTRAFDDEAGFSAAELEVLQSLVARREALDERSAELDRRESLLRAAENRIDAKVQELKQLQGTIEASMRKFDEQEDARRRSLIKMFESMKPKEAARIFEQMDIPVLVDLVEKMREAKAAPIMAEMAPTRAKQIAGELAKRRSPTAGG